MLMNFSYIIMPQKSSGVCTRNKNTSCTALLMEVHWKYVHLTATMYNLFSVYSMMLVGHPAVEITHIMVRSCFGSMLTGCHLLH